MIRILKLAAVLMSVPSLLVWLWRGRRPDPSVGEADAVHSAMDEARYFEAEWREAEQTALAALQELDEAYATIGQLHLEIEQAWVLTRELLLLNACGYYGNVRFDYDEQGVVRGVFISHNDRIMFAPAGEIEKHIPPAQWNLN